MSDHETEPVQDDADGEMTEQKRAHVAQSIGRGERLATTAVGGVLLAAGLRRRSLSGGAMAVGGGWLVARGLSGTGRPLRTLGSAATGERDEAAPTDGTEPLTVDRVITVGVPADELTAYWRDPEQLTRIMGPVAEVTGAGEDRHHWELQPPRGPSLSWETEIVDDRPGERLRWESLEGATIPTGGEVRFRPAPGDRGTEVTLRLQFDPPGGKLGAAVVQRLGIVPKTIAETALRRFKSLAETGEIPSTEANPSARGSGDLV
ncbi:SRPBCC family protein [Natrinema zhouii]|uniref:SRPBCC family protein n=1 Tax=Natrinema zhouii TaxID=1710539 RepID=A0A7D6CRV8_9EURY|nr:SRPBCC family protein [Natrinema zhouii]QLK26353.1 SRPBCC family protein [Natrinema zhouii]